MFGNNKAKKPKHERQNQPRSSVYTWVRNGKESHFEISVK